MNAGVLIIDSEEAARCSSRYGECSLTAWYDIAQYRTVVAHAHDEDPEHWLYVPDCTQLKPRRAATMQRFVRRWLHRLHSWEADHE